jgi:hypothetical protein
MLQTRPNLNDADKRTYNTNEIYSTKRQPMYLVHTTTLLVSVHSLTFNTVPQITLFDVTSKHKLATYKHVTLNSDVCVTYTSWQHTSCSHNTTIHYNTCLLQHIIIRSMPAKVGPHTIDSNFARCRRNCSHCMHYEYF